MTTVTAHPDRATPATVRFLASQAVTYERPGTCYSPTWLQAARRTRTGMGEESPIARKEAHGR
jgi:hypothetical protein